MKRIQLFEFEDQPWFPDWIRVLMTRYISNFHKLLDSANLMKPLIEKGLSHTKEKVILDLCSGNGGPMPDIFHDLQQKKPGHKLLLSDLYPNKKAADKFNADTANNIQYLTTSLDATKVSPEIKGLRTMVSSLHHMKPEVAHEILSNAKISGQPILIYEISDNSPPIFLWWLAIPFALIATLILTPMIRPLSWQQVVFTYLIPILPLLIAWDGAVSNARTYTLEDMAQLIEGLSDEKYAWEMGKIDGKGGKKLFLLGKPSDV
ncbi:hypothetical protein [Mongoliibacter ruber]|uniref:Methyltransferase family protein n=1 Tax=Mongoliibacter ruber TaxID=1750599 RepID=A0A2T0WT27_9BACT|nr:hypothetical protein [Mongoliibacter ruber]PRY89856.1 hypothetical protein CLW00_102332 [Mongoliibacter ruber]